ncbi:hypothetical protein Ddye_009583 [Dipteronia dyeriana]|uniref:EF-hand domain-containing protein n=1 Tax=Dipteronia dyeriana TaxID=168575 RepID=A0AAE0CMG6_9ROSI|nr:hypothetical protein Ddye_009583 [Dipteronia dyeriana]
MEHPFPYPFEIYIRIPTSIPISSHHSSPPPTPALPIHPQFPLIAHLSPELHPERDSAAVELINDEKAVALVDFENSTTIKLCELRATGHGEASDGEQQSRDGENEKKLETQLYDSIFDKFDLDSSETVDVEEFISEMKKTLVDIDDGLGFFPIQMVHEDRYHNFLKQAADLEASKPLHPST